MQYILSIDQSTSGTKALLLDREGELVGRADLPHAQKVNGKGWVSHDPVEIYRNTLLAAGKLLDATGVDPAGIEAIGISNQRETALVWDRDTGLPVADAVVWQCGRAQDICARLAGRGEEISRKTGLRLSPYFPAAKWAWLLENTPDLQGRRLCAGTIDSWLLYKLTGQFKTDYSNASRTQLFDIHRLCWDQGLCGAFGVDRGLLPAVCMSDSRFGDTDLEGLLPRPVPVHGVLGDSHGALFGQGCVKPGMGKATYGTGSSVMVHVGEAPVHSGRGIVTSLAWGMGGKVQYVLEGNINYAGAVTTWVAEGLGLLASPKEAGRVAAQADPEDGTYLVPAFTGLGAPYWQPAARGMFWGMGRGTGRAELVKAAEECIGYQIADVVEAMREEGIPLTELRADGGPTRDGYLMQFQADILGLPVAVPEREELSGMGAGYCAGIACGLYRPEVLERAGRHSYRPQKGSGWMEKHYGGWKKAVGMLV
ncbi:FGGY-family carbohydrate kinase [Acutalibacter caecimuris]|uniref:FGGY-family carbohydrate kinase n=1 Tax=Acutalibacter caecimuris TaxID=3093657 RepID=UPI002AC9D9CA|nr:FGGY family carbohydrate kinase [Acutalibacter sp. M00118]